MQAARQLLERTGLINDTNMRSLLNLRQNSSNLFTSRRLQFNMTSEVQRNLSVLANLDVLAILSLESGYDRHIREKTEFTLIIKVDF